MYRLVPPCTTTEAGPPGEQCGQVLRLGAVQTTGDNLAAPAGAGIQIIGPITQDTSTLSSGAPQLAEDPRWCITVICPGHEICQPALKHAATAHAHVPLGRMSPCLARLLLKAGIDRGTAGVLLLEGQFVLIDTGLISRPGKEGAHHENDQGNHSAGEG